MRGFARRVLVALLGAAAIVAALRFLVRTPADEPERFSCRWPAMGTVAQMQVRAGVWRGGVDRARADEWRDGVQRVYGRLEGLLSAWNPESELSRLSAAGCTNWLDETSPEVRPCYAAALRLAEETGGAFDPRIGERLRALGVGGGRYSRFDLGAIAKGFAVDVAAGELERALDGASLLLDLGGNLRVVGDGEWRTGVRNPFSAADARQPGVCAVIRLASGESAATSGNYERFFEKGGRRLSHILDGRTGEHVGGIAGVTVVTPREYGAMLADGLSTALFVMGPEEGSAFLARCYPLALALWIPDDPSAPRIVATPGMAHRLEQAIWPVSDVPRP